MGSSGVEWDIKWREMAANGIKRHGIISNGTKWYQMVPNGTKWYNSKLKRTRLNGIKVGSKWDQVGY